MLLSTQPIGNMHVCFSKRIPAVDICVQTGMSIQGAHVREGLVVEALKVVWFLFFPLFL